MTVPHLRRHPFGRIAALLVCGYRRFVSPLKPKTCRFEPTCSAYAVEAYRLHGLAFGTALTGWRLLRCQPLCRGGLDPVPGSELADVLATGERDDRQPGGEAAPPRADGPSADPTTAPRQGR